MSPRPHKAAYRSAFKRKVDFQIISDWIEADTRVLDIGCGRGILLEHLRKTKNVYGVGVDVDPRKILGCVKRNVCAYQGQAEAIMREFPENFFDWVICSRTLPELANAEEVLLGALRVGRKLAVGVVNHGYWRNRVSMLTTGHRVRNDVYPEPWNRSRPSNGLTINEFKEFCQEHNLVIAREDYLRGDWRSECLLLPNLRAGYAVFEVRR